MNVQMWNAESLSLIEMTEFVQASQQIEFNGQGRQEIYGWVQQTLVEQEYFRQRKKHRGVIRAYLCKVTGLSLSQTSRLILQYRQNGRIAASYRRHRFPRTYTDADIALLAEVDKAHQWLSGPATKKILQRECEVFANKQFERVAEISVSHLYNLRRSATYRKRAGRYETTKPTGVTIAERRRPDPQGRPGFLRVDTVHQGDWDGAKGVYHLNAVDTVTQWEVVGCTPRISEQYLEPVLEAMLHQFPFPILGFHTDNGSEFINRTVAKLLNKLLVEEFTKSRPHHSLDNALVESKNGAIIRKHIGYGHIPAPHADSIDRFYRKYFNPYLNYHRPCGFATVSVDRRGKQKRTYKTADYSTPYDKLKSLPNAEQYLKQGVSFEQLDRMAHALSDTECARRMKRAKEKLLRECKIESPLPPRF
jgi:hypothetical protein